MGVCLLILYGYIIGRLDEKHGKKFGFWLGCLTIRKFKAARNRITVKPYSIGMHTGYFHHIVSGFYFDWNMGCWYYHTDRDACLSHDLVKWYEDNPKAPHSQK